METNDENIERDRTETENASAFHSGLPMYMLTDPDGVTCKLQFKDYFYLFVVIEDLIEISLHTLYNAESENSGHVKHPTRHLVSVLELIKQLLPGDTGQTLAELNEYLNQKREEENLKQNNESPKND
jgi:hypothetical protein